MARNAMAARQRSERLDNTSPARSVVAEASRPQADTEPSDSTTPRLEDGDDFDVDAEPGVSYITEIAHAPVEAQEDGFLRGLDFSALRATEHGEAQTSTQGLTEAREWVAKGNDEYRQGELSAARRCYNAALRADPTFAPAHNNLGNIRAQIGDLQGAIKDYDTAIQLDPAYVAAYSNRGSARQGSGDLEGAIADYDRALALDPANAHAFNNRGNARTDLGNLPGAIEDFVEALRIDPCSEIALNNRGAVRRKMGDLDGAFDDYDAAIALNPFYAGAFANRGDAHLMRGRAELAIRDYERYLGLGGGILDGDHEQVQTLVADVRAHAHL